MLELGRLKDLLEDKHTAENYAFNHKVELERQLDEHKVKLFTTESRLKELEEAYKNWLRKETVLKKAVRRFEGQMRREDDERKSGERRDRNIAKEAVQVFRNVVIGRDAEECDNKENECRLSNGNNRSKKQSKRYSEAGIPSYRSCTLEGERAEPKKQIHPTERTE
jgi:hypothetical protein